MTRYPVVMIGDAAVDMVVRLPGAPGAVSVHATSPEPELSGGGSVANTAAAGASLGIPTAFMGPVGEDAYGSFLREGLSALGIDTSAVVTQPGAFTLMVIATVDRTGERYFSIYPHQGSAIARFRPEQVNEAMIRQAAWAHFSGWTLVESPAREAILYAMQVAREAAVPISLDLNLRLTSDVFPADYRTAIERAIEHTDFLFGSAVEELHFLTGTTDPERSGHILANGLRTVIPRLGAEGSMAITPDGKAFHSPAYKTTIVDTIGAGDSFDAGFIAAMVEGQPINEGLRWGNALGALTIAREGARGGISRAELETLLRNGETI